MKAILVKVILAVGLAATVALTCNPSEEDPPINDKDIHYTSYEGMNYPPLASQTRTEGAVVVRVKIDDHGRVTDATAISGHELLIQSAIDNAKKWRFETNSHHGVILVYSFRIASGLCNSGFFTFQPPNFVTVTGCPMVATIY
ncbi:MAG TPA: energy transducer TonB [Verrucomicrobiae bacterium]|nr:energy transducer TonB [Verrucomicrobiae bacterium]